MQKWLRLLPAFLLTGIKLFLLEFLILSVFRIIFYIAFKTPETSGVDSVTILKAFRMGFEFDMVATSYAIYLPVLLLLLHEIFHHKTNVFNRIGFIVTFVIFGLYAFVSCADFPYFKQFNSHLSRQAFLWTASPGFVLKMIFGNISYYGYLFLFAGFLYVLYRFLKVIFRDNLEHARLEPVSKVKASLGAVLLIPFLIVGGRGRLSSKSTTHEGLAIVSENLFVNQIALNPNFTLFRSLLFQKVKNYKVPTTIDADISFARQYLGIQGPYERSVSRMEQSDSAFRPFNVVIVCMESMSSYKMGIHHRQVLTPNFNKFIGESVYFDRFFSSGIHTFNGLFSTSSGYPSMLTEHGLRRYMKAPFTTLGNLLETKGYQTYFCSTHDPHFDNMEGFFTQNGYKNTFSAFDLPKEKTLSATGVPDHELFDLFIERINKGDPKKPFLGFIMTGSDHGPWVIPTDVPFHPDADTEEKRATQYADWALGRFIEAVKKQSWYKNTLFVFLGDHGYATDGTYEMPLSYHNIPFVLHKPNTFAADTIHNLGYQPDVVSTVAGVLNLPYNNTSFGLNILENKHPFVYFTADDKIGCISDDGYFFYELVTQQTKRLRKYTNLDQTDYYTTQKAKADSLEHSAKSMLNAAEYFIRQNYFSY